MNRSNSIALPLLVGLGACLPAQASWLQICPGQQVALSGQPYAQITRPDRASLLATVSDMPASPSCEQLELGVSSSEVIGLRAIRPPAEAGHASWFSLSGKKEGHRFEFGEVISGTSAPGQASPPQPVPLRSNLLPSLRATPFSAENRASVTLSKGQLYLRCAAGRQAAGLVLRTNALPTRARARLHITGTGNGRFEIISVNAEQLATESGDRLGYFEAQRQAHPQAYSLGNDWVQWTIACPTSAAALRLSTLQLIPEARLTPTRAAWVWKSQEWQQQSDAVLRRAKKYGIGTLFITVPLSTGHVQDASELAAFIRRAIAMGIDVWAVDGDPDMVKLQERPATLQRIRAYSRFNRSVPPDARLKGVQFDVEPYLLAAYDLAVETWDRRYVELVDALHDADPDIARGTLKLEMVVPFWWADKPALLSAIAPLVSGLVVMDYRSEAREIYRFAVPFLDWGERHGKTVRIALEAGPIAPETRTRYEQAEVGELWQLRLGENHFLMMLGTARPNPHGKAFRQANSYEISGRETTFFGETGRLWRQLPGLETNFSAWPAFGGMALHEIR